MKKIGYEDLYEMNFLSDINFSPDKKHAFFLKHNADKKKNGYKSYIYILETESSKIRQLTFAGDEKSPVWLDDDTIIFTSKRNSEGKNDRTDYFSLSLSGGEGRPLFTINEKVKSLKPLKDGKFALLAERKAKKQEKKENEAGEGEDYLIFDEIYFWSNGEGIRNKVRNTLVIFDSKTNELRDISDKYALVLGFAVSPDKNKILFSTHTYKDVYKPQNGLYMLDVNSNSTKEIIPEDKFEVGDLIFLDDKKAFFTLCEREFPGQNAHFAILDTETGKYEILPYKDFDIGGAVGTDAGFGAGSSKRVYNKKLYMTYAHWGNTHMRALDMDKNYEDVIKSDGSVSSFDISDDKIYMTAMRDEKLSEIYCYDLKTKKFQRLSDFNGEYHREHTMSPHEYFTFQNRDGITLDGFVLKPVDYEKGKKYPGILEIHGGPKTIFGPTFHHEMQILANKGYFVFYTNPRGSDGRGSDFANITAKLGTIDYNDLMDFTDEVIKRYPDLDEARIGICGGSYGGFMCNWMIGHTQRFAAAVSQRSISNYLTKSLTTDIGYYHNMSQLRGTPWTDFDTVWDTSPLKYAVNAKTPTLFIQSDQDYRCYMSDAMQMFTAIKLNGADSKIALFHNEHHGLSRVGRPENRIARLMEICRWFDTYLK